MAKNIVVCCDNIGNEYGKNNTNVVDLCGLLIRDSDQITYYDPGVGIDLTVEQQIGTAVSAIPIPGIGLLHLLWQKRLNPILANYLGIDLEENVRDAYEYLMDNYEPEDKLYLFGVSRGAFVVRALAGMLSKCGLLQKGNKKLIRSAEKIYNTRGDYEIAAGFKLTYCHECKPYLIGVWDSIQNYGLFYGRKFLDSILNYDVTYGYQAIAIDEKRRRFEIKPWDETMKASHQTIEQVWFAGVHGDVVGWYYEKDLSDIALEWMLMKAESNGLKLKPGWKRKLNPKPTGRMGQSRKGIWLLWKPTARKIPDGALIHQSVTDRMNKVSSYSPNLPPNFTIVS